MQMLIVQTGQQQPAHRIDDNFSMTFLQPRPKRLDGTIGNLNIDALERPGLAENFRIAN